MPVDEVLTRTTATYDAIARDYEDRTREPPAGYTAFREAFTSALGPSAYVADLGCGPGRDAVEFLREGLRVAALDASHAMVMRTIQHGLSVVRADLRRLPFARGSLDGLWSSASLLHVPRNEVPATLREWRRVLTSRGLLGLSTSLGDDEGWECVPYDVKAQPRDLPLSRWFVHHQSAELLECLRAAGFDVLSTQERRSSRRWLQVLATAST